MELKYKSINNKEMHKYLARIIKKNKWSQDFKIHNLNLNIYLKMLIRTK